jgi:HNH endonuclease
VEDPQQHFPFEIASQDEYDSMSQQGKRCTKCRQVKPASAFTRDRQKADGLRSSCKECDTSKPCAVSGCGKPAKSRGYCGMHDWRLRERGSLLWEPEEPPEVPPGYKFCPACDQAKPHAAFSRCSWTSDGLQSACKDCKLRQQREARERAREEGRLPSYDVSVETKRCTNCDQMKPAADFARNRGNRDGLFSWCKECWREHDKAYYAANTEKCREKSRTWRIKNPERWRETYGRYWRSHRPQVYAKNQRYRERHPDRVRAQKKAAYERDPEATRAAKRAERERNKDRYRAYEEWRYYNKPGYKEAAKARAAAWAREHRAVMLVYGHVRRARRYKAEGAHTADDIRRLYEEQKGLCYYCQVPLNGRFHLDHKQPLSKEGSEWPANLACTCAVCNLSKGALTEQEFRDKIAHLERIRGKSWAEVAAEVGLKRRTLGRRLERGWSLEEALSTAVGLRRLEQMAGEGGTSAAK